MADLIHKVLFYMDHSYFCVGLPLLVIVAGGRGGREAAVCGQALSGSPEVLGSGSRDFVLLQPEDAGDLHSLSEVAWVGWMLIFGTQGDVFLSP